MLFGTTKCSKREQDFLFVALHKCAKQLLGKAVCIFTAAVSGGCCSAVSRWSSAAVQQAKPLF